ncbi:MAG: metallophosphoesterase [Hyphomicrobiales bacterium]
MKFTLAHFSDVHLAPLKAGDVFGEFRTKRLIGGVSWATRRRHQHERRIADALKADILAHQPDHIAFTGDLVNIAATREFAEGAAWMTGFTTPEQMSFVPGNHDAYVRRAHATGLAQVAQYAGSSAEAHPDEHFPFVKLKRNIALIGLSSAAPQSLWSAGGHVGERQLNALSAKLSDLRQRGFFRAVMIHHPPLPGLAKPRRALADAEKLEKVLASNGAELVLHGHNHTTMFHTLATQTGKAHIIGVPSASMGHGHTHEAAAWMAYDIDRKKGQWNTVYRMRRWDDAAGRFRDAETGELGHGPDAPATGAAS